MHDALGLCWRCVEMHNLTFAASGTMVESIGPDVVVPYREVK